MIHVVYALASGVCEHAAIASTTTLATWNTAEGPTMKIDLEKFLAITALLATASVVDGCTSDNKASSGGSGGSDSGAGGSGSGGKSGSGGSGSGGKTSKDSGAGGGATGGHHGGGTDSGTDAGGDAGACLYNDAPDWSLPDGSTNRCTTFASTVCPNAPDAGGEGHQAYGSAFCIAAAGELRPGINNAMLNCIAALPGDPCSKSYGAAALKCLDDAVARSCTWDAFPALPADAGGDNCDAIHTACAGISAAQCRHLLSSFTEEGTAGTCAYNAGMAGGATCVSDMWNCILGTTGVSR
jgi:hypothetical protein